MKKIYLIYWPSTLIDLKMLKISRKMHISHNDISWDILIRLTLLNLHFLSYLLHLFTLGFNNRPRLWEHVSVSMVMQIVGMLALQQHYNLIIFCHPWRYFLRLHNCLNHYIVYISSCFTRVFAHINCRYLLSKVCSGINTGLFKCKNASLNYIVNGIMYYHDCKRPVFFTNNIYLHIYIKHFDSGPILFLFDKDTTLEKQSYNVVELYFMVFFNNVLYVLHLK